MNDVLLTEVLHHPVHQAGQIIDWDVEEEGAALDAQSQVDERVEGERWHVRLAPLSSLRLQVLLVFDPPRMQGFIVLLNFS